MLIINISKVKQKKENENPLEIIEFFMKIYYKIHISKKISKSYKIIIESIFRNIFKSTKFSDLTDFFRLKKFDVLSFTEILENFTNFTNFSQINYYIFHRNNFFFLTETMLLTSKNKNLTSSFLFYLSEFLSVNENFEKAFLIIDKFFPKKKISESIKLLKNLKKFDIFFQSKKYTKAKYILNKLQAYNSREYPISHIISEIAFRFAKFSLKEQKLSCTISYLIEGLLKLENSNKFSFSIYAVLLLFCSNFVKNFKFGFLPKIINNLPKNYNFLLFKFTSFLVKNNSLAGFDIFCKKINLNKENKLMKRITKKFFNNILFKKIKKLSISYLRLTLNSMSVILGIPKKKLYKTIESLIIKKKKNSYYNIKSQSFIFFEKKKLPEFIFLLMIVLIQLNSLLTLKLNRKI